MNWLPTLAIIGAITATILIVRALSRAGDQAAATDWAERVDTATFVPGDRQ